MKPVYDEIAMMRKRNTENSGRGNSLAKHLGITLVALTILSAGLSSASAGDLERRQAKRIHDRLAGVPPTDLIVGPSGETTLELMEADILAGNPEAAAQRAMDNPGFYDVTLKNFAMPWSNEAQDVFAPLNDYVATVIGMVRDDVPFNEVLSADIIYVGDSGKVPGLPAYSNTDNNHYAYLENNSANLKDVLIQQPQSTTTGLPAGATAGVITTRAAARAFFIDGTNRAMFRFTMINHLCTDLDPIKDTSRDPGRIRQDVSRSPGGDSRIFLNNCVGCHAGMDPMAQAFAYYNYQYPAGDEEAGQLVYTAGSVQPKYLINSDTFKFGYVTPDDHWDNYWRAGPNSALGWSSSLPGSGNGAKSLGEELAATDAFAQCQAKKVFKTVCLRDPAIADGTEINNLVSAFKNSNYNLKAVFAGAAVACMGD